MTQPKRKRDERAELVKLIQSVIPGDYVKVLESSIQRIVEEEVSMVLGAAPYQRSEARTNYRNGYRERIELTTPPTSCTHLCAMVLESVHKDLP